MTKLTDLATKIATEAHAGQTRWDKETPYITHPAAIARAIIQAGFDEDYVAIAWLHDVLEDTKVTAVDLVRMGIPKYLVESIEVISKREGQSYLDYILDVQADEKARVVKMFDIRHNMSDLKHGSMRQKYELALYILSEKI